MNINIAAEMRELAAHAREQNYSAWEQKCHDSMRSIENAAKSGRTEAWVANFDCDGEAGRRDFMRDWFAARGFTTELRRDFNDRGRAFDSLYVLWGQP